MTEHGLHVERTALAWSRTWLAAAVGVGLSLRLVVGHGTWLLVAVIVVCLIVSLAAAVVTPRRGPARAAVLLVASVAIGLMTIGGTVTRMMVP